MIIIMAIIIMIIIIVIIIIMLCSTCDNISVFLHSCWKTDGPNEKNKINKKYTTIVLYLF